MTSGILTTMLNQFVTTATLGYSALMPDAMYLMQFFVALEVVLVGLWWALGKDGISVTAIKKLTTIFFFLWVLSNFRTISRAIVASLGQAGIVASGNAIPLSIIFDPSAIVDLGFTATAPVFQNAGGVWSQISSPIDTMIMGWSGVFILLAYFFIAINMFLVVIEFYIFTVCSVLMIPFALFRPTAWLSEKAIGGTFSLGIKVMVLSLVVGLTYNHLQGLAIPPDPEYADLFRMLLSAGFIAFISWHAPSVAAGYLSGSPNLSGGAAAGFTAVGAAGAVGATRQVSPLMRKSGAYAYEKAVSMGKGAADLTRKIVRPGGAG